MKWFVSVFRLLVFFVVLFFFIKGFYSWNSENQRCDLVVNKEYFNDSYTVNGTLRDLYLYLNVSRGFLGLNNVVTPYPGDSLVCRYALW